MTDRFVRIRMDPEDAKVRRGILTVTVFLPTKSGDLFMADLVMICANDAVALSHLREIAFEEVTPDA